MPTVTYHVVVPVLELVKKSVLRPQETVKATFVIRGFADSGRYYPNPAERDADGAVFNNIPERGGLIYFTFQLRANREFTVSCKWRQPQGGTTKITLVSPSDDAPGLTDIELHQVDVTCEKDTSYPIANYVYYIDKGTLVFGVEVNNGKQPVRQHEVPVGAHRICNCPTESVSGSLMGLFTQGEFADCRGCNCHFQVEGQTYYAHRDILISAGGVFAVMLTPNPGGHQWPEHESGEIVVDDFDSPDVLAFLKAIYCPQSIFNYVFENASMIFDIYRLAHKYEVSSVMSLCESSFNFLKIDQNSMEEAIGFARMFKMKTVRET